MSFSLSSLAVAGAITVVSISPIVLSPMTKAQQPATQIGWEMDMKEKVNIKHDAPIGTLSAASLQALLKLQQLDAEINESSEKGFEDSTKKLGAAGWELVSIAVFQTVETDSTGISEVQLHTQGYFKRRIQKKR